MRRIARDMLFAAAAVLLLTGPMAAQPMPDAAGVEIVTKPLGSGGFLLQGSDGSNVFAQVGPDGMLVVDDQYATLDAKLAAALERLLPPGKPLRYVINTHYHWDHTGGNALLASKGAVVVAQAAVRGRLAAGATGGTGGASTFTMPPAPTGALPAITFTDELTLHFNNEVVRIEHAPVAHTDGDAIVTFEESKVVHMGDIYVRYGFPYIDVKAQGTVAGMIRACEQVIAAAPANAIIIPGHGEAATRDDLKRYVAMLRATTLAVSRGLAAGRSVAQLQRAKILQRWDGEYGHGFVPQDEFIQSLAISIRMSRKVKAAHKAS